MLIEENAKLTGLCWGRVECIHSADRSFLKWDARVRDAMVA
jgi:hypothetical protein